MGKSKGHIVLIEQYYHSEVVLGYIRIFFYLEYRISLLAPADIHQQLENTDIVGAYEAVNCRRGENLNKYHSLLCGADLLILTTIEAEFDPFLLENVSVPKLVVLHSANFYFRKELLGGVCNPKAFLKRIHLIVKGQWHKRSKWMNEMDGFIFGHDIVAAYVRKKYPEWQHKRMLAIPFSPFLNKKSNSSSDERIKIIVPGTLNTRARDYRPMLEALGRLRSVKGLPDVDIIFLGRPTGRNGNILAKRFRDLSKSNFTVRIYHEELSFSEYEAQLLDSDFMILPLRRKSCYFSSSERLNETYFSGTVYDMVKAAKPALMPMGSPLPPGIDELTKRYSDAVELYDILLDWIKNKSYQNLDSSILKHEFSLENLAEMINISDFDKLK